MSALVFMPWLTVSKPCVVGDFELLPALASSKERSPSETKAQWADPTEDGRRILCAYKWSRDREIRSATLVRFAGRDLTADLSEDEVDRLFTFGEAIAFTGLSQRRFFEYNRYWNRDSFLIVGQRFKPGQAGVTIFSRRRDGSNMNFVPDGYHSVLPEAHVVQVRGFDLDTGLAGAVLAEMDGSQDFDRAIRMFNEANTDRSSLSQAQELISTVSAIQRLLNVKGGTAKETRKAFLDEMALVPEGGVSPTKQRAIDRLKASPQGLRGLWVDDLYALRGNVGHGHAATTLPSVWTAQEHLLIAAHLFPLLVKKRLASRGRRAMTDPENDELGGFDWVLSAENLLAADEEIDGIATSYQWQRLHRQGVDEARMARIVRKLDGREPGT